MKHHREQHFQRIFGSVESLKSGRPTLHLVCSSGKGPNGRSSQLERVLAVWQQTNAFAGTESQETVNHKEEAEHVGVWRSTGGVERRQKEGSRALQIV